MSPRQGQPVQHLSFKLLTGQDLIEDNLLSRELSPTLPRNQPEGLRTPRVRTVEVQTQTEGHPSEPAHQVNLN